MKIAFLGSGIMGAPMAKRLLEAGHEVYVYNRTKSKADKLVGQGAMAVTNAAEAVAPSDCVILMLAHKAAIEEALWAEGDINFKDKTIIQMGTIAPAESIELQKKIFKHGGEYFECPVLGSKTEAIDGKLILLVGSTPEKFENWQAFLKVFGPNPRRVGEVGHAATFKLALNQLIASHAVSFSFSLALIKHNGMEIKQFMDVLRESVLYAPMFDRKLPNWLEGKYDNANFSLKHLLKDVELMMATARDNNMAADHLTAIASLLKEAIKKGLADKDYSAVYNVIAPK